MTYQQGFRLDVDATSTVIGRLSYSASRAESAAGVVDDALAALPESVRASDALDVRAALVGFAQARVGSGDALAAHLSTVSASAGAAVSVLVETDRAVAREAHHLT